MDQKGNANNIKENQLNTKINQLSNSAEIIRMITYQMLDKKCCEAK